MRVIAYLVALIYAHSAIAGLPPTKLGGQSGTAFTNFNFFTPANQSTKVAGGGLIETGNRNLLINGEFEAALLAGPAILGWTETGTSSPQDEASFPIFGKKSLRFLPSGETIILTQDVTQSDALDGANAQIKFSAVNTAPNVKACVRQNGTTLSGDSNCVTLATDDVKRDYVIPTKFGTNSTGVSFESPSTTGTLIIDSVELGDRLDVSDVQQARLHGSATSARTLNCSWNNTAAGPIAFAADADCPTMTTTGSVLAPATKVPGFVLRGKPGDYEILLVGTIQVINFTSEASRCNFLLNNGTTSSGRQRAGISSAGAALTAGVYPGIRFQYTKTSSSDETLQIFSEAASGSTCNIDADLADLAFTVYYYPPANKIFSTDSLGWFIDANIGGANPDLGVANVSTYTEITNAGLDLVVNTAKGSQSAKILCSGTNPPTGTTCSAGSESVGISFVIPKSGQYEVCAQFTHNIEVGSSANSTVLTAFQLAETATNSTSIIQEGGERPSTALRTPIASNSQEASFPYRSCSVFNFTSVGEKAVRLMYEQQVDASPTTSRLYADRISVAGQRDIHFTVKPAINIERINGSFAQIEDSLKTIPNHNYVINGNFDFWQRGTSLGAGTGNRYLADRFFTSSIGSTVTPSRQTFTLGQTDVPNSPTYFHRSVVASSAGADNYAIQVHATEGVARLAGKTVTVSFWAKADATRPIAVEFQQAFGSGGSPSSPVTGTGVKAFTATTSWQKFTQTVTVPSIAGKTLGTNNNDSFGILFWFDCGSSFAARCGSIGQQSGTFDIAQVKLEEGINATPFVLAGGTIAGERENCERFYQTGYVIDSAYQAAGSDRAITLPFKVTMRGTPVVTATASGTNTNHGAISVSALSGASGPYGWLVFSPTTALGFVRNEATLTADAEL